MRTINQCCGFTLRWDDDSEVKRTVIEFSIQVGEYCQHQRYVCYCGNSTYALTCLGCENQYGNDGDGGRNSPRGVPPLKIWILGTPACETHEHTKLLGRKQALKDARPDEGTPRAGRSRAGVHDQLKHLAVLLLSFSSFYLVWRSIRGLRVG